jgi:hypothetical protein
MAIEAYLVAFDIQQAASGYNIPFQEKLGAKEEATIAGAAEFEGTGLTTEAGLLAQVGSNVATAYLVEVKASSAAEAVEVVRLKYGTTAGGSRAVVKPNKTNFRVVV